MPAAGALTAADHILWTQRIRKEEAVNGKATGSFSVRAAIQSVDVPKRFKPNHDDPGNPASRVGFHPKSKEAQQLKLDLHLLQAPPRGKYPWPETSYQDHGWLQKDFGTSEASPAGLKTLAGVEPAVGLGWQDRPSNDPLQFTKAHYGLRDKPSKDPLPSFEMPVPSGPKAQRERCPFGAISPEATRAAREKADARRAARAASSSSAVATREVLKTPSASSSKAIAPALTRAASEPDYAKLMQIAATANRPAPVSQDRAVTMERALERSRIFYNRHPKYERWYKPLSNSDVAHFADNYSKCWGVQFFAKPKQK